MYGKHSLIFTALLLVPSLPALCAEGAVPIYEPTTITEPGRYVLTRNVSSSDPITIDIDADDVHFDLNGFTVKNTYASGGTAIEANDSDRLVVRNGKLVGGGVSVSGSKDVLITGLIVEGAKVGISFGFETGGEISHNIITGATFGGIEVVFTLPTRVVGNTVRDMIGTGDYDDGILVTGFGCFVAENMVEGSSAGGIRIDGSYNHIERNVMYNNNRGLHLAGNDNVYRGNLARSNTTDFQNDGTGNTSNRDNYMPGNI